MKYFPFVFHPGVMLGGGVLLLIYTEWRRQHADRSMLRKRVGVLVAAGVISLVPSLVYMLVAGVGPMEAMQGNAWQVDALVASGVGVVAGTMWFVWNRFEWGQIVPRALAAVTVPYIALSPFWNISGHVVLAVMPTLSLVLVDRRFWPLLVIPAVMVVNRPYVGAHTWAQSLAALLVASALVVAVFRRRQSDSVTSSTVPSRG
jgi:hypothetical protein